MRIALAIDQFDPRKGGAERYAFALVRGLLDTGHELHIFSRRLGPRLDGAFGHPIPVSSFPRGLREWRFASAVEQTLRGEAFDVSLGLGRVFGADVLMPHGGVHAAWFERDLSSQSPLRRLLLGKSRRWMSRQHRNALRIETIQYRDPGLRAVIAVSQLVKEELLQHHPLAPERVPVIRNGVDLDRYHPGLRLSLGRQGRARWGLGDGPVVLFAANNFRLKGLGAFLRILAAVQGEMGDPRVKGLVVGGGHQTPYRSLARRIGCLGQVRFAGPLEQMEQAFAVADVLLQPTYHDTCSLTTLEALACGVPVVTTRHNGASEVLHTPLAGFIVEEPEQVALLAAETARLLRTNRADREEVAGAARTCVERLSAQENLAAVLRVLEEAAEEKRQIPRTVLIPG